MSGHKRTTIHTGMQDLKEFSQAEMSLRFMESGLDQLNRRMDDKAVSDRKQQAHRDQVEKQRWKENLDLLGETVNQLESNINIALASQKMDLGDTIQQLSEEWGQEYLQQISELKEQYQTDLDDLNAWQQASFQPIADEVVELIDTQHDKASYFQQLFNLVLESQHSLEQEPEIERIFPGIGERSQEKIYQAYENGQAGFLDAAVTGLDNTYRELLQIRMDYELFRSNYNYEILFARAELEKLEQEILLNLQVPGMDLEGRILPSTIIVDDWVAGAMTHLHHLVQSAHRKLGDPTSPLKLAAIERLNTKKIPQWRNKIGELVTRARIEVINSQLRMNIANLALNALADQGYQVEEANYDEADMRRDYCVQMVDIEGSRVVVKVKTDPDQPRSMMLDLFTSDQEKRTPHEIAQRAAELQRNLQRAGLHVGTFEPVRDHGLLPRYLPEPRKTEIPHRREIRVNHEH